MTLKEYVDNPAGKGDSSMNRAILQQIYDQKYEKYITNKDKQIKCTYYKVMNKDAYYVHLVMPTETERDNTYDVVFYFYPSEKSKVSVSLYNHNIKVFSNSPSFAYTFAYVYNQNQMLIPGLRDKYPQEMIKQKPEVKNRYEVMNYDKYLFFAAKYLLETKSLNKAIMSVKMLTYTPQVLSMRVRNLDRIMIDYRKAKNKLDKAKKTINLPKKGVLGKVKSTNTKNPSVKEVQKIQKKTGSSKHVAKIAKKKKK